MYTAPSAPRNVAVTMTTTNSLTLTWEPPVPANGEISQYSYECVQQGAIGEGGEGNGERIVVSDDVMGKQRSETISNLQPYTSYTCSVNATTGGGTGPPSQSVTTTTNQDGM